MTDLKSTKKKHFEGTQLKLREYQRLRNTDSDIFKNKKESEEISSERQEQRIKHIKHLAVKIQSYSKPTEIPIVYNTPTYKDIETKRRKLESPSNNCFYLYNFFSLKFLFLNNIIDFYRVFNLQQ